MIVQVREIVTHLDMEKASRSLLKTKDKIGVDHLKGYPHVKREKVGEHAKLQKKSACLSMWLSH